MRSINDCLLELTKGKVKYSTDKITVFQAFELAKLYAKQYEIKLEGIRRGYRNNTKTRGAREMIKKIREETNYN